MKKLKLIAVLSLVVLTSIMLVACGGKENRFPCPSGCGHNDTYEGMSFDDDKVVVVIKENFGSRTFTADDFKIVNAKEIVMVMPALNPSDRPILNVILSNTGRQNVVCAVQLIKTLEFVYGAEPVLNNVEAGND